jgi:hypothetical protein
MSEYRLSPDEADDFGVLLNSTTRKDAIEESFGLIGISTHLSEAWSLTQVVRDGDPSLNTAVDEKGQHYEIPLAAFIIDKEVGYVRLVEE